MKTYIAILLATFIPAIASAQQHAYETLEQSRQRHNADNYDTYRNNNYQAPMNGYRERLGDTAPAGTTRPGMINNYPSLNQPQNADPLEYRRR